MVKNRIQLNFVVDTLVEISEGKFASTPVVGASVTIKNRITEATPTVYGTEAGESAVVPTTDSNGRINGWLEEGSYTIKVTGGKPYIAVTEYNWDALSGRGIENPRVGEESVWRKDLRKDENFNDAQSILESLVPTGTILAFGGASAPAGFLLCDGKEYAEAEYNRLFKVIGYTFGKPSAGKFNVPDMRGRTLLGAGSGPGLTARTIGTKEGAETVTLTTGQLASHTHGQVSVGGSASVSGSVSGSLGGTIADHAHYPQYGHAFITWDSNGEENAAPRYLSKSSSGETKVLWGNAGVNTSTGSVTGAVGCSVSGALGGSMAGSIITNSGTTDATGGGGAHPNIPPFLCVNGIIKT